MRITREYILKFIQETVKRRARSNSNLLAAFLCGSFLGENYTLGGAADIDLFFIYEKPPDLDREVLPVTDDISLDINHRGQNDYKDTRYLRTHPWLGPSISVCKILYDPQHFMSFTQASVRGQYDRMDFVFQRASSQAKMARQIWFQLKEEKDLHAPQTVEKYLSAVENSANAIASLTGPPLPERRLLLEFPPRAQSLSRPGLFQGLLGLLGSAYLERDAIENWLAAWSDAFQSLPESGIPAIFQPSRLNYYLSALRELAGSSQPATVLWTLVSTWTRIAGLHPEDSQQRLVWERALNFLEIAGPGLIGRVTALDSYLDLVDETLEIWAKENGVWE